VTPTRWQQIQELVNNALELPVEARAVYLDQACGGDIGMRRQIEDLVESYERAGSFLERAVGTSACDVLAVESPAQGERIGAYEITGVIGHGGMGSVYCARRVDDQFHQNVAIKVLRGGIGQSPELLRRFRAERQILARLAHANIARLLDGGITASGLPYLVMEYIEGTTIDVFCEQAALGVSERVRLVRDVCAAVQYAHQNLIVHRDIKPANVMVTQDGTPKLLDFGIAKLLGPDSLQTVPLTRPAERLMTPEYASPEQIRGEPVTTATDVYAMGVLLYELVSGTRPFRVENVTPAILERLICETVPVRPSAAGANHGKARAEKIGVDLDNIILKALHKDPARRYATAAELSEDLRRYLEGFPVLARADSWWYRTRRFVSRHRMATAAAALFAVTTSALTIGLALETRRAHREADAANRISDFLVSLFEDFRPDRTLGRSTNAKDILDRGAERIPAELAGQPLVEARLFNILGTTYRELGVFDRAESLLSRAQAIRSRVLGPDSRETAETVLARAAIASDRGEFDRADQFYRKALSTYTKLDGPKSEDAIDAREGLGEVRRMLGDLAGAKQRYLEVIAVCTETKGPTHVRTLNATNDLVAVLADQGDYAAAETLARKNLATEKTVLGPNHPYVPLTLNLLAYVLARTARFAEAEATLRQGLEIMRKVYGTEHPAIALSLMDLSALARELGHYDEAQRLGEEALAMSIRLSGPRSLGTAGCQGQLGLTELARGELRRSRELLEAALETRKALGNPNNPDLGDNYDRVGMVDLAMKDLAAAHRNIERGLEIRRSFYGPANENVVLSLNHMAQVLAAEGNYKAAEQGYREAIGIADTKFKEGHTMTADGLLGLGTVLLSEGRPGEAKAPLLRALKIRQKLLPAEHPGIAQATAALARCNLAMERAHAGPVAF
jgi:eukaryotic-like serine/threonine-protein kinase